MDERKSIAAILRIVADLIENASFKDLDDIVSGRASLSIARNTQAGLPPRDGVRQRDSEKRRRPTGRDLSGIVDDLRQLPSREAGFTLLATLQLARKNLESLARIMDLPVVREDDAEQLRRKIVESSIGARLNSQAIRGE